MLKITAPYVRETAVRDEAEGKNIVLHIVPPGNTINFRLRYGRQSWPLSVKDAYIAARYTSVGHGPRQTPVPKPAPVSVKSEIVNILRAGGKQNIATILQKLKEKRISLDRRQAGEWLDTLKEMGQVKQDGFNYQLTGK